MNEQVIYVSFLVRLWCEIEVDKPTGTTSWQGEVESIQSGRSWRFDSLETVLNFLDLQTRNLLSNPAERDENS